jgi:hypothetical protein
VEQSNSLTLYQEPQLTPQVWAMIEAVAAAAHESHKVGVSTRGEAALKFLFCYENGLALSTANTGLYIVNGRIAAQSNIIAAQIRRHPDYDYRVKSLDNQGCTIEILRREADTGKWRVEGEASFTEDDAKRAKLDSKDNYQGYPSDMFFNRALARAQRRFAPDIFSQPVYMPEEMGMATNAEGDVIEGSWSDLPPAPVQPVQQGADTLSQSTQGTAPTLAELTERYDPAAIMAANDGKIPGTTEELAAVAAKLEEAGNG